MSELKILVVDDEARMRKIVKDFLVAKDYTVLEAANGEEALDIMYDNNNKIDLVILDIMMPKMDGWETCREIRKISKVPIIMLTAKGDETDELLGYDLGIDEYITKPFSPKILVARIDAILRRANKLNEEDIIKAGELEINKTSHVVKVSGKEVELSFKEFELLCYFAENKGIALSREKILNSVWNYDYFGDARTIDTHVKKIRSKLGKCGEYIKTIWGMGYKFEADE
ncbi:MAG: response regulator transcription factor [Lachnospiraceae bacterium]|nr:response regulator transcription factor [Lachnospiraceae bacterium]